MKLAQLGVKPRQIGRDAHCGGMGCFWGAERRFWKTPGVYSTHVGYAGGFTVNPLYKEVCSGLTGHSEVVRVIYEPKKVSFEELLKIFWENHDPTQGMRQGKDVGTQYRSVIYTYIPYQLEMALKSKEVYQKANKKRCELKDFTAPHFGVSGDAGGHKLKFPYQNSSEDAMCSPTPLFIS
ncbi:MSRA reductase, partial [Polypterus senegalus]|nr:MSRA reductase [Polypterus senegalus]